MLVQAAAFFFATHEVKCTVMLAFYFCIVKLKLLLVFTSPIQQSCSPVMTIEKKHLTGLEKMFISVKKKLFDFKIYNYFEEKPFLRLHIS